jgi:CheY-like chemotaxis protein
MLASAWGRRPRRKAPPLAQRKKSGRSPGTGESAETGDAVPPESALGTEIGSIVHDLRNVFSAVRGLATVIGEELPPHDLLRADVDEILKAVDRGVAVSQRLSALRARADVQPVPEAGSDVPASDERERELERSISWPSQQPKRSATILIVEADDPVRATSVRLLRRHGYTTLEAATAAEAEERVLAYGAAVDLVMVDVGLSRLGAGGADLVERLRQRWPGLKVLFVSGFPRAALADRGLRVGSDLLEKPFRPLTLLERVEALLAPGRS